MPRVAIKAALQSLLSDAYVAPTGDGRLKHVNTQYPRLSDQIAPEDFPRAVIFEAGYQEQQIAGGNAALPIGIKEILWTFTVHLATLIAEPLQDGDAWDQLLDDIEATLRLHPTLESARGPGYQVLSAQKMRGRTLPPIQNQMENAFNSYIDVSVRETINA